MKSKTQKRQEAAERAGVPVKASTAGGFSDHRGRYLPDWRPQLNVLRPDFADYSTDELRAGGLQLLEFGPIGSQDLCIDDAVMLMRPSDGAIGYYPILLYVRSIMYAPHLLRLGLGPDFSHAEGGEPVVGLGALRTGKPAWWERCSNVVVRIPYGCTLQPRVRRSSVPFDVGRKAPGHLGIRS